VANGAREGLATVSVLLDDIFAQRLDPDLPLVIH